jgi:hypothetical protein
MVSRQQQTSKDTNQPCALESLFVMAAAAKARKSESAEQVQRLGERASFAGQQEVLLRS